MGSGSHLLASLQQIMLQDNAMHALPLALKSPCCVRISSPWRAAITTGSSDGAK